MACSPAYGKVITLVLLPGSTIPRIQGWSFGSMLLSNMVDPRASVLATNTKGQAKMSA